MTMSEQTTVDLRPFVNLLYGGTYSVSSLSTWKIQCMDKCIGVSSSNHY